MPVTVPRLVVEVFEHINYGGRSAVVIEPIRFTGDIGFQDNISSVKVYKGPAFTSAPNYKVILYEHINFGGRKLPLGPGFYPNLHDTAYNFPDRVSSIGFGPDLQGAGPEWGTLPVIVETYPLPNFQGEKVLILRDIAFTKTIGMQDRIQSIRIFKGPNFPPAGCRVVFYEHIDFQGASLPIEVRPSDYVIEIPDLAALPERWSRTISSVSIEGWTTSTEFSQLVFHDEFDGETLDPGWRWEDPRGHGQWSAHQGYLQMNVAPGVDLWRGANFDAPRLIRQIEGDFAIETRLPVTPQLKEHGGLLVWKDRNNFIRLEKTSGPHAFNGDVRFERHYAGGWMLVGHGPGLKRAKQVYLRLERFGNRFLGYASEDGVNWLYVGEAIASMRDPVWVGMHALCPGSIPPTQTRFDYFRIYRRPHEATLYEPPQSQPESGSQTLATWQVMRRIVR